MAVVVNEPLESAIVVVVEPSGSVMVTVSPHAKPVPDSVTVSPTFPLVGEGASDCVTPVAVKLAEAWLIVSTAVTLLWKAEDVDGAVNVTPAGMLPDPSVVTVAGDVTTVVPSYFIVIPLLAPKLLPDTVTVVGTLWLVGESEIVANDATNGELAVLVPSVAGIVWRPVVVEIGIVIIFVNEPLESVVAVVVEPSGSVMVTVEVALYPVPDTVTESPTFPLVGDTVIVGVIVNVELAVLVPSVPGMV